MQMKILQRGALEPEPVKAASLVGSVIVSEIQKKFGKKTESE